MGNLCCPRDGKEVDQDGFATERTRLLRDSDEANVVSRPSNYNADRSTAPFSRPDLQTAVSHIVEEVAVQVIDVAEQEPNCLEQHEYIEKSMLYARNVQELSSGQVRRKQPPTLRSVGNVQTLLASSALDPSDVELISHAAQVLHEQVSNLALKQPDELVVQFQVP